MEYLVILKKVRGKWAAHSPDIPGCKVTGSTPQETLLGYRKALRVHLKGLAEDGQPFPESTTRAQYVHVS
ncbi:MAG TPA: type II toxin-antitoxin system HicB family antitoxin [Spirochaetia bacterium]|nr:type II toxin-antitoxin system HicB family antitoxin [Spirochaetia bacterium]